MSGGAVASRFGCWNGAPCAGDSLVGGLPARIRWALLPATTLEPVEGLPAETGRARPSPHPWATLGQRGSPQKPEEPRVALERATRIELAFSAWEADVLPLNYARRTRMNDSRSGRPLGMGKIG